MFLKRLLSMKTFIYVFYHVSLFVMSYCYYLPCLVIMYHVLLLFAMFYYLSCLFF